MNDGKHPTVMIESLRSSVLLLMWGTTAWHFGEYECNRGEVGTVYIKA